MTLADRKAFVDAATSFVDYRKRWESLPPMPIEDLASAIVDADLTRHLNYEESGEEGYLQSLCMDRYYTLPEGWESLPQIAACNRAADEIASAHAEDHPHVMDIAEAFASLLPEP